MREFNRRKQKCFNKFRNGLLKRKTEAEERFESLLLDLDIPFAEQKGLLAKSKTFAILDYYLQKPYRIAIEIDGGYHNTPMQVIKDALREQFLKERRIHLIRFKNEEVLEAPEKVKEKLLAFMVKAVQANKSARLRKDRPVLVSK